MKKIIISVLLALIFSLDALPAYRRGPTLETKGTLRKKARIENVDENYAAYIARKGLRTLKGPTRFSRPRWELDPQDDWVVFAPKKQMPAKCKKATPALNHKENDKHKEKVTRNSIIEAQIPNYILQQIELQEIELQQLRQMQQLRQNEQQRRREAERLAFQAFKNLNRSR